MSRALFSPQNENRKYLLSHGGARREDVAEAPSPWQFVERLFEWQLKDAAAAVVWETFFW